MALKKHRHVKVLSQRGNGIVVHIPSELLQRLGWNLHDAVLLNVIENCLVVSRIEVQEPNLTMVKKQVQDAEAAQVAKA